MIRLVALDLDGTLVGPDLTVSARTRRAIAAAQAQGTVVTLATGRMFDVTLTFARDLGLTAPLICYQGGLIRPPDGEPLYRATMAPALMRELLDWQAERGWHAVLYADDWAFIAGKRYPEEFYYRLLGRRLVWVDALLPLLERHEPVKFLIVAEPPEADAIESEMRARFGAVLEVVRSHAMFVEGNPPGVSKGDALRRLAAHLGIPRSQVMAVGDQGNDRTMIEWAGIGVAMGNGSSAVRAVADWVAPPLEEDGAAVAIERFVLGGRRPSGDAASAAS